MPSTTATSIWSACSGSSPTSPRESGRRCRSRSSRCSSTHSSSARTGPGRDRALLGSDADPFGAWAEATAPAWRASGTTSQAVYVDYDVIAGKRVGRRHGGRSRALSAGVPTQSRAERTVGRLRGLARARRGLGLAATSLSPADPGFQPTRYWRGPVWPILNWVLQRGLVRYGYRESRRAGPGSGRRARRGARGSGSTTDPLTGKGHGGEQFAWTRRSSSTSSRDGEVRTEEVGGGEH